MAKVFGNNNIIACKLGSPPSRNLMAVTADGNERNLGGYGSPITQIINAADHAIIICEDGSEYMYNFKTGSDRKIR